MKKVCIGVVGARERSLPQDKEKIKKCLIALIEKAKNTDTIVYLISGGCRSGADAFAEELANELGLHIVIHKPDVTLLPKNPQRYHWAYINFKRNTLIAEDSHILIALPGKGNGTKDTIKKAKKLNKQVIII